MKVLENAVKTENWKKVAMAALVAATMVTASRHASAGPKDEDLKGRREEAAKLHQEGAQLFTKGDYEAARAKFREAYARGQNPNSLLNQAEATIRGYHYLEAATLLKAYLALPENDKVTATDRKDAQALLDEASAKLCTLDLRVSSCTVDGTAGQGLVMVEVGEHLVRMQGPKGEKLKAVKCGARETVLVTYEDEPVKGGGTGPGPVTPPPKEEGEKGSWLVPGVLAGVGVVGIGVGLGLGAAAKGKSDDLAASIQPGQCVDASRCSEQSSTISSVSGLNTGAIVGYVVGGSALVGAIIATVVIRPWETRPTRRAGWIAPAFGPQTLGFAAQGSF